MADAMPSLNIASSMSAGADASSGISANGGTGDGGVFAGVLGQTMAGTETSPAPESTGTPIGQTAGVTSPSPAEGAVLNGTAETETATATPTYAALLESKLQTPLNLSVKGIQATAEGDQTAVQTLAAQLAQIQQTLQQQGVNVDTLSQSTENLKQALVALGMSDADATIAAQDIQDSLATATQTLNLDAAGQNAMALMLVASAAGAAGVQQPLPAITVKTPAATSAAAKTTAAASVFKGLNTSSTQLARTVAGVETTPATSETASAPEPEITIKEGKATSTFSTSQNNASLPQNTAVLLNPTSATSLPAPEITQNSTTSEAQNQAVSIPTQVTTSMAAGAERIAPQTTKVAENQTISKPSGETLYKWKPSETGVETLEAAPAVGDTSSTAMSSVFMQQNNMLDPTSTANLGHGKFENYLSQAQTSASVAQQTAVQFQGLAKDGGGTVRLKLHPEQLGEVIIELKVTGGEVSGSISATQAQAVHELARDLHQLKQSLADAGLRLGSEGINLMLNNSGQNSTGQGGSQSGQDSSGFGGNAGESAALSSAETPAESWSDTPYWVAPDKVLDVRI